MYHYFFVAVGWVVYVLFWSQGFVSFDNDLLYEEKEGVFLWDFRGSKTRELHLLVGKRRWTERDERTNMAGISLLPCFLFSSFYLTSCFLVTNV
jgi:hypothetical protein